LIRKGACRNGMGQKRKRQKEKSIFFLPENGRKKRGRKEKGIINCVVLRKEP
jgi:hypothetical protein